MDNFVDNVDNFVDMKKRPWSPDNRDRASWRNMKAEQLSYGVVGCSAVKSLVSMYLHSPTVEAVISLNQYPIYVPELG